MGRAKGMNDGDESSVGTTKGLPPAGDESWVIFHYDAPASWWLRHSAWPVGTTQDAGLVTPIVFWFLMYLLYFSAFIYKKH